MERYSPSVRRRRLGKALRGLRDARGLTADQASKDLGMSPSALTKIETADRNVSKTSLVGILTYYGASEKDQRELLELHAQSREKGWWQEYGIQPGAFIDWEAEAIKIQSWEPLLVPGILQTEEYAEAILSATQPDVAAEQRTRWAKVRAERGALIEDPGDTELWYLIGEAALRTKVGGDEVMHTQIQRLIDVAETPSLTIQVLPFEAGAHPGVDGAFSVLTFADLPPLACVEHVRNTVWLEKVKDLNALTTAFGRLSGQAWTPKDSIRWMRQLQKEVQLK
jgi:transcriptional regulator with XRE-family HTH domain